MTETGFVRITHKTLRQSNRVYDLDCDYSARSEKKPQITYPIKKKIQTIQTAVFSWNDQQFINIISVTTKLKLRDNNKIQVNTNKPLPFCIYFHKNYKTLENF